MGENTKGMSVVLALGPPKTNYNGVKGITIEQRRQLALYYKCGDKYGPSHQCKQQLLKMEGKEEEKDEEEGEVNEEDMELAGEAKVEDEGREISFHALREPTGKIIKVKRQAKRKKLMVLIDSGNTYSYLS